MSWVAAATAAGGLLASGSGGGGGSAAPAGPSVLESGKVTFGEIHLTPKSSVPSWLVPVVAILAALGGLFLLLRNSRR